MSRAVRPPVTGEPALTYVENFQARVLQDAWVEATAEYWRRRARTAASTLPRRGDYRGGPVDWETGAPTTAPQPYVDWKMGWPTVGWSPNMHRRHVIPPEMLEHRAPAKPRSNQDLAGAVEAITHAHAMAAACAARAVLSALSREELLEALNALPGGATA